MEERGCLTGDVCFKSQNTLFCNMNGSTLSGKSLKCHYHCLPLHYNPADVPVVKGLTLFNSWQLGVSENQTFSMSVKCSLAISFSPPVLAHVLKYSFPKSSVYDESDIL